MRLLSYNIHKGFGNDRRYRLDRIVEVMLAAEADVVCLQEVDFNVKRSQFDDQPRILADALEATGVCYQLNVPRREGGYGNLLLSRWPVHTSSDVCLRYGRWKPRAAQVAVVEGPKQPLCVVNWHLGLRESERRWQARKLLEHGEFRDHAEALPAVVLGDSNDWRNRLERDFSEHGFEHVTGPAGAYKSFPSFLPIASLDKAFTRDIPSTRAEIVRSPEARRASDHLPLVLELDWEPSSDAAESDAAESGADESDAPKSDPAESGAGGASSDSA